MFVKKPWKGKVSIYEDYKIKGTSKGYELPDEEIRRKQVGFGWVPGALDGAFGHHSGSKGADYELAILLKRIALKGKLKDKVNFYKQVESDQICGMVDSFLEKIVEIEIPKSKYLNEWCHFLVLESPDRGAVKIGIALSGLIGYTELLDSIRILGKHEEFTLYSSVAIMNMIDNPEQELWELAKNVHGWGRIHLVERLANTKNKEIKEWILREGYKNSIMYEYLALISAKIGMLHKALSKEGVDYELLLSARILLMH